MTIKKNVKHTVLQSISTNFIENNGISIDSLDVKTVVAYRQQIGRLLKTT